ncbi:MAG: hypothetical protein WCP06_12435 [Verrucomicrobiota bacterium]
MNRRQLLFLATGVVLVHLVAFALISGANPLPKVPFIAPPNFFAREASWVDEKTGEHITYHEYQVRTKLAMPDQLMQKRE